MSKSGMPTSFFRLLSSIFPKQDPHVLWTQALELSNTSGAKEDYVLLLQTQTDLLQNQEMSQNLQALYEKGYDLKHILLYLRAPQESKFREQTTKEEYLNLWNKDHSFVPKTARSEIVQRGAMCLTTLMTLTGLTVIAPTIAVGFSDSTHTLLQIAEMMAMGMGGNFQDVAEVVRQQSIGNLISFAGTVVGGSILGFDFHAKRKESKQINLVSKIRDGTQNEKERERLFQMLQDTPVCIQHLISHFSPEETCLFLKSDERTQERMWRVRPPSYTQRCLSNLVDGNEFLPEKIWQQSKIAGSDWKQEGRLDGPVSLKESILKMREKCQQKDPPPALGAKPSL